MELIHLILPRSCLRWTLALFLLLFLCTIFAPCVVFKIAHDVIFFFTLYALLSKDIRIVPVAIPLCQEPRVRRGETLRRPHTHSSTTHTHNSSTSPQVCPIASHTAGSSPTSDAHIYCMRTSRPQCSVGGGCASCGAGTTTQVPSQLSGETPSSVALPVLTNTPGGGAGPGPGGKEAELIKTK